MFLTASKENQIFFTLAFEVKTILDYIFIERKYGTHRVKTQKTLIKPQFLKNIP